MTPPNDIQSAKMVCLESFCFVYRYGRAIDWKSRQSRSGCRYQTCMPCTFPLSLSYNNNKVAAALSIWPKTAAWYIVYSQVSHSIHPLWPKQAVSCYLMRLVEIRSTLRKDKGWAQPDFETCLRNKRLLRFGSQEVRHCISL